MFYIHVQETVLPHSKTVALFWNFQEQLFSYEVLKSIYNRCYW